MATKTTRSTSGKPGPAAEKTSSSAGKGTSDASPPSEMGAEDESASDAHRSNDKSGPAGPVKSASKQWGAKGKP